MQAALCITPSIFPCTPTKCFSMLKISPPRLAGSPTSRFSPIVATAAASEASNFDYSSTFSVFPAEACETIGGDACQADIYPEVKLQPEAKTNILKIASELIEREYLEYTDPKTVLLGEACDVLGGEFCETAYQTGVY